MKTRSVVRIISDRIPEEERSELEFVVSKEVVNLDALRRLVSRGHLDGTLRALVWKLLLCYLPIERDSWEVELTKTRLRYANLKPELLVDPSNFSREEATFTLSHQIGKTDLDGPLCRHDICKGDHLPSLGSSSMWHQYFKNAEIIEQIDRHLQRSYPDMDFFSGDSALSKTNMAIRTVLLIFAELNPVIGYVQGMNDFLAPYTMYLEQIRMIKMLLNSIDHFRRQLDNSSSGILATLSQLSELLKANDEELWWHLETSKVNVQFYAFRWITLLLTQEFEFYSIMMIWDSLLSNPSGVQEMLLRVCCAMLLNIRHELLNVSFASSLKLLQHYPQTGIDKVLAVARKLTSLSSSPHIRLLVTAS